MVLRTMGNNREATGVQSATVAKMRYSTADTAAQQASQHVADLGFKRSLSMLQTADAQGQGSMHADGPSPKKRFVAVYNPANTYIDSQGRMIVATSGQVAMAEAQAKLRAAGHSINTIQGTQDLANGTNSNFAARPMIASPAPGTPSATAGQQLGMGRAGHIVAGAHAAMVSMGQVHTAAQQQDVRMDLRTLHAMQQQAQRTQHAQHVASLSSASANALQHAGMQQGMVPIAGGRLLAKMPRPGQAVQVMLHQPQAGPQHSANNLQHADMLQHFPQAIGGAGHGRSGPQMLGIPQQLLPAGSFVSHPDMHGSMQSGVHAAYMQQGNAMSQTQHAVNAPCAGTHMQAVADCQMQSVKHAAQPTQSTGQKPAADYTSSPHVVKAEGCTGGAEPAHLQHTAFPAGTGQTCSAASQGSGSARMQRVDVSPEVLSAAQVLMMGCPVTRSSSQPMLPTSNSTHTRTPPQSTAWGTNAGGGAAAGADRRSIEAGTHAAGEAMHVLSPFTVPEGMLQPPQAEVQALRAQVAQLQAGKMVMAQMEKLLASKKEALATSNSTCGELEKALAAERAEKQALAAGRAEAEARAAELEQAVNMLKVKLKQANAVSAAATSSAAAVPAKLAAQLSALQNQVANDQGLIAQLRSLLSADTLALCEGLAAARAQLAESRAHAAEAEASKEAVQEQLKLFQRTVARLQSEVSVLASHQALGDTQRQELSVLRQQNECLAAMLDNMRMTTHALIERTRLTAAQVAGAAGLVGPAVKAAVFNGAIESVGAMQQQQPTVPEAAPACAASSTHASPAIADEPAGAPDCKVPTVNAVGGPTALSAHAGGSVGHGVGALPLDASVTGGANMTCADVNGSHAATSAKTLGSELGSKTSGA